MRSPKSKSLEQPLVAALAVLRHALAVGARKLDVALQRRDERREVIVSPRQLPALLPVGLGTGAFDRELVGHAPRALPVAARDAHEVAIELVEVRCRGIDLLEPLADLRAGGALVGEARERSKLVRARRRAGGGHHHQLIPAGEHLDGAEIG